MHRFILLISILSLAQPLLAAPDGQKLYKKHCSACHNEDGIGGIGLPLNSYKINSFSRDYLFKTIRLGREGRIMPSFKELSDAQINALIDYIFLWKKSPTEITYSTASVIGNLQQGKILFEDKCAECHGKDGRSEGIGTGVSSSREREFHVIPPALNNPGFLAAATDEWIKKTVTEGRPGTIMPTSKKLKLSSTDIDNIVSYVRSFQASYEAPPALEENQPTLVFDSPYDFETTVSNLKQSLQGMNFRFFPDRYMEMGLADDNVINKKQLSLRFCNFKQLYQMINTEPRLGIVLPCRVTVVEDPNDGQVRIYTMNMRLVSRMFNNTQLTEAAEEMHILLMALIDESTL